MEVKDGGEDAAAETVPLSLHFCSSIEQEKESLNPELRFHVVESCWHGFPGMRMRSIEMESGLVSEEMALV